MRPKTVPGSCRSSTRRLTPNAAPPVRGLNGRVRVEDDVPHVGATPQHLVEMSDRDAESGLTFSSAGKSGKLLRFDRSEAEDG
jgi:hypothetical protein